MNKSSNGLPVAALALACLTIGALLPVPLTLIGTRFPSSVWPRSINFVLGVIMRISSLGLVVGLVGFVLRQWWKWYGDSGVPADEQPAENEAPTIVYSSGSKVRVLPLADVGPLAALRLSEGDPVTLELERVIGPALPSVFLVDYAGERIGELPPSVAAPYIHLMSVGKVLFAAIRKSPGVYGPLELHISWERIDPPIIGAAEMEPPVLPDGKALRSRNDIS